MTLFTMDFIYLLVRRWSLWSIDISHRLIHRHRHRFDAIWHVIPSINIKNESIFFAMNSI